MKKNIFKKIVASLATVAMAAGLFTAMPAQEAKADGVDWNDGTVYIVGPNISGGWDAANPKDMSYDSTTGKYSYTFNAEKNKVYEFKFIADKNWDNAWGPSTGGNFAYLALKDGSATITFEPAVNSDAAASATGLVSPNPKDEFYVVGSMNNWSFTANKMEVKDGKFVATFSNLAAGEVKFKIVQDAPTYEWYKAFPDNDYVLDLTEASDVTITFDKDSKEIAVDKKAATTGGNTAGDNTTGGNTAGDNTTGGNTAGDNTTGGNTTGGNTTGGNTTDNKTEDNKTEDNKTEDDSANKPADKPASTTKAPSKLYVVGTPTNWGEFKEMKAVGNGVFTYTFEGLKAGSEAEFKFTLEADWKGEVCGVNEEGEPANFKTKVGADGKLTVTLDFNKLGEPTDNQGNPRYVVAADSKALTFTAPTTGAAGTEKPGDVAPVMLMLAVAVVAAGMVVASKKKTICE